MIQEIDDGITVRDFILGLEGVKSLEKRRDSNYSGQLDIKMNVANEQNVLKQIE